LVWGLYSSQKKGKGLRVRRRVKKGKISEKEKADIRTLMRFAEIFCRENHNGVRNPFFLRSPNYELITPN